MKRHAIDDNGIMKRKKEDAVDGFALSLITFTVGVDPMYIYSIGEAIQIHLSKWIGKYQSNLHGFCLAYFDGKATTKLGGTLGDCPSIYIPCQAKFLMFYPKIDTNVQIKLVSSSPHHIGGLLLGFIHVSIPKSYIPSEFEFQYDNTIAGKWTRNGIGFSIGDIIRCTIIGTKQDGHEMTLIGTIATEREQIKEFIKSFSPDHIPYDLVTATNHSDSSSDSLDSDDSDSDKDSPSSNESNSNKSNLSESKKLDQE